MTKPQPRLIYPRYTIITTSGSTDYLRDTTGSQRLLPVRVPLGHAEGQDDGSVSRRRRL